MNLVAIILAYVSLFYLGLSDNVRGPVYPEILTSFGLNNSMGSFFFSIASAAGFFGSFVARFFLNKLGSGKTLLGAVLLMSLSQLFVGLSQQFSVVLFFSFFFGASIGVMGVVQNILVLEGAPAEKAQRFQSGLHANYGFASLLAPLLVAGLASIFNGWRETFFVCSGIGLILAFFVATKMNSPGLAAPKEAKTKSDVNHFEAIMFGAILAAYVVCEIMVSSRIALFVRTVSQADLETSSLYTSGFFVFLLAGRLLFIIWQPALKISTQMVASLAGSIFLVGAGINIHPFFLVLSGLAMAPFYPLAITAMGALFPNGLNSAASTTMALISVFVVSMHFMVGFLSDSLGIASALWIGPLFCLFAIGLLFLYPQVFGKKLP